MQQSKFLSYIYISISVILWGFSMIWTNQLIQANIPPYTFIFFRMFFAGAGLMLFSKLINKLQKIEKQDIKWILIMVLFEPFIYFIGETYGIKLTNSPTVCALIIALVPVATLISGQIFFREKISKLNILGTILTVPGVALMVLQSENISVQYKWGLALLFMAVIGSTGYSTVVKKLTNKYNSFTLASYQFFVGSIYFLPIFLIKNNGYPIIELLEPQTLFPLMALAILCSCIAFGLYITSIRNIGLTRSVIFTALIPAVSAVGAYLYGQETMTPLQIVGIAIVTIGVIFTQDLGFKRNKRKSDSKSL